MRSPAKNNLKVPFKSCKFETANRAYENENHKTVISTQSLQTIATGSIGNSRDQTRLPQVVCGPRSPDECGRGPTPFSAAPDAAQDEERRRRRRPAVGLGKCMWSCEHSECTSRGKHTLGQGQLQRLHRPWEESAFHQRPLGPTPRQRRRSLDGIKDHAADVRFGPVLSYI